MTASIVLDDGDRRARPRAAGIGHASEGLSRTSRARRAGLMFLGVCREVPHCRVILLQERITMDAGRAHVHRESRDRSFSGAIASEWRPGPLSEEGREWLVAQSRRRLNSIVLSAGLVSMAVLFGVRATYIPVVYRAPAVLLLIVIGVAAWNLGARAIRSEALERRRLAVAGGLLIAPWALFAVLAGMGTPWQATHAENQLRYLVLLVNAIAVAGGLVVLTKALSDAGERFYSTLGFAAILLAAPLYLVWAAILLELHRALELVGSGEVPAWIHSLADLSDVLLFFGGVLTYFATAAFAMSLERTRWLGRAATRAFVIASSFALLCLVIRGLQYPDPAAVSEHWYTVPGFVVGIPAIPWIMPCMFGVVLLRRAGHEPG
jgi:hypothetical protein